MPLHVEIHRLSRTVFIQPARTFADATQSDRPVKLFRSIHEARRWIAEVSDAFGG